MAEPTYELQLAALERLRETSAVTDLVGTRIYDRVPEKNAGGVLAPNVESPYVSFGPVTAVPDDVDCVDGLEVTFQLDAWSWGADAAYGSVEVREIAGAITKALHKADLDLATHALVSIRHELTRILRESDGITNHAAIQFTALVETN